MADQLGKAIALCSAWAADDTATWAGLTQEAIDNGEAVRVIGELTHVVLDLARAIAGVEGSTVEAVLQRYALDAEGQ